MAGHQVISCCMTIIHATSCRTPKGSEAVMRGNLNSVFHPSIRLWPSFEFRFTRESALDRPEKVVPAVSVASESASALGNRLCVPFQGEKRNYNGSTLPLVAASFSTGQKGCMGDRASAHPGLPCFDWTPAPDPSIDRSIDTGARCSASSMPTEASTAAALPSHPAR